MRREQPAAVRQAIVLGCLQACITLFPAANLIFTLLDSGSRRLTAAEIVLQWAAVVGMLAIVAVLFWGSARLRSERGRWLYLLGCGAQLAVCGYFLATMIYGITQAAEEAEKQLLAIFLPVPILIAVLPIAAIARVRRKATIDFLRS
jgi:hypothetical protein